jgi:hypothetical protein
MECDGRLVCPSKVEPRQVIGKKPYTVSDQGLDSVITLTPMWSVIIVAEKNK